MPLAQIAGDLSVFEIDLEDDGTYADYLGTIQEVTLSGDLSTVNAAPINRTYDRMQAARKGLTITAPLMSVKTGSVKVSTLDLSAFSFGGTDYVAYLVDGEFTCEQNLVQATAAKDFFSYPISGGTKSLTFEGNILVPATAALGSQALPTAFFSATPTDHDATVTFTINGVTTTAAMTFSRFEKQFTRGEAQVFRVRAETNSPDSGTYPAAPTGTTTIWERLLNTQTRHRLRLTDHASEGQQYAGNAILRRGTIRITNSGLIYVGYEWESQGAWTSTPN